MAADSPSKSHAPFAAWNRLVNPVVRGLLRSPAHRVISGRMALLSVTGSKSGRTYTFPVEYTREEEVVTVTVGWPERKRWWRNLRSGAAVTMVLAGVERTGQAVATGDETSGVTVTIQLDPVTA